MLENLLAVLERSDADLRFAISCDQPYRSRMFGDPATTMAGNRFIHDLVRQAPGRLYGSCAINPDSVEEALRVMDVCFIS